MTEKKALHLCIAFAMERIASHLDILRSDGLLASGAFETILIGVALRAHGQVIDSLESTLQERFAATLAHKAFLVSVGVHGFHTGQTNISSTSGTTALVAGGGGSRNRGGNARSGSRSGSRRSRSGGRGLALGGRSTTFRAELAGDTGATSTAFLGTRRGGRGGLAFVYETQIIG